MSQQNNRIPVDMTVEDVKAYLSQTEYNAARAKITEAEDTLEEVKTIITKTLILNNDGILLTGAIEYAAFRVETLSLIFELASRQFRKSAKDGEGAYDDFLRNLGVEVGFTFARDMLNRLEENKLFTRLNTVSDFIRLWMLYENDTGAGYTTLRGSDDEKFVIQINGNPLRKNESIPHRHCGFYKYYIRSLLNELMGSRARILSKKLDIPFSGSVSV